MAIHEIPASFEHTCDGCKKVVITSTQSRPAYWSDFHINRDAYDFQGHAVADGSVHLQLCDACTDLAIKAVNSAIDERRPFRQGGMNDATLS